MDTDQEISTVQDVIGRWRSVSEFARDLGLKRETHGTVMKVRGSIPIAYWPRLIEAAKARGIKGITYAKLVEVHETTRKLKADRPFGRNESADTAPAGEAA